MRKKNTLFILPVFFVFILSGCAGQNPRINSRQLEMDNLKRQIQFLQKQNAQLARELQNMKGQLEETAVSTQQVRADFSTKMDELLEQMEIVQSRLKDTDDSMSNMRNKAALTVSSQPQPDVSQPEMTTPPVEQSFAVAEERELYNMSRKDLNRGNYQLAMQGFLQFVSQYPSSELTDNAQYWIGEVYYAQGRFQDAIQEFEKVVKLYPGADKTPSALLKIGFCYFNLEEVEQAKIYLEEVVTKHPDSDEANLARGRLATLN